MHATSRWAVLTAIVFVAISTPADDEAALTNFREGIGQLAVGAPMTKAILILGPPYTKRVFRHEGQEWEEWTYPTGKRQQNTLRFIEGRLNATHPINYAVDASFIHDSSPIMSKRAEIKRNKLSRIVVGDATEALRAASNNQQIPALVQPSEDVYGCKVQANNDHRSRHLTHD